LDCLIGEGTADARRLRLADQRRPAKQRLRKSGVNFPTKTKNLKPFRHRRHQLYEDFR
jgi:hypothetical protein